MFVESFLDFIGKSSSSFHFCNLIRSKLKSSGFLELSEYSELKEIPKKGFFIRDGCELVAFNIEDIKSAMIVSANCNYLCLKIRKNDYDKIKNVGDQIHRIEYNGINDESWMNKDVKIIGKVVYLNESNEICEKLYDSKCPFGFINFDKKELNCTLGIGNNISLKMFVAESLKINVDNIVDMDLRFIDSQDYATINNTLISGPLNGLGNAYSSFCSFLEANPKNRTNIFYLSDFQENPRFGTNSSLLKFAIQQLVGNESQKLIPFYANSLLICNEISDAFNDNSDDHNKPRLDSGVVLKCINGNLIKEYQLTSFARKEGIKIQKSEESYNDTITTNLGIPCLIISLPLLGIHFSRQILHINDLLNHKKLMNQLYCNENC